MAESSLRGEPGGSSASAQRLEHGHRRQIDRTGMRSMPTARDPLPARPSAAGPLAAEPRQAEPLWRQVLGQRLRAIRRGRGETLATTAGRAGVSPQYLSEIERGRKEPSSELIAAIAGALGGTLLTVTEQVAADLRRQRDSAAPGAVAPGAVAPGAAATGAVGSRAVTPRPVTPRPVTPRPVTPRPVTPRVVAPRAASPRAFTPRVSVLARAA